VSALYLIKTIYSAILSVIYLFLPAPFPFEPIQVTPINMFTVGIPSFFLALRGNNKKPEGLFVANVLRFSLPAALAISINLMIIQIFSNIFSIPHREAVMMRIVATAATGFYALYLLSRPKEKYLLQYLSLIAAFLACIFIFTPFFRISVVGIGRAALFIPLFALIPALFCVTGKIIKTKRMK
jgi:cation-transporting ATPase E